jgi:hypothetical protein
MKETTTMLEERTLDYTLRDLTTLKKELPELADLDKRTNKAKAELSVVSAALEKVRAEIASLRDQAAIENHQWQREREGLRAQRQSLRQQMEHELEGEKADLLVTQNAIAAGHRELDGLAAEYARERRRLGL